MQVVYKGDYIFKETLETCPQVFEVFVREDKIMEKQVAEVRVRNGVIVCYTPEVGGELIYRKEMKHTLSLFKNDNEMNHYLSGVALALDEHLESDKVKLSSVLMWVKNKLSESSEANVVIDRAELEELYCKVTGDRYESTQDGVKRLLKL